VTKEITKELPKWQYSQLVSFHNCKTNHFWAKLLVKIAENMKSDFNKILILFRLGSAALYKMKFVTIQEI
jgi:hypothetical protein